MSNKYISGSISKDFPLYHSSLIPIYTPRENPQHNKHFSPIKIMYSNEHPDMFRLKVMKEGGYINPHLKDIPAMDRELYIKKIDNLRNKIKFIDYIKSSRKLSQNMKYINLINHDDYVRKKILDGSQDVSPPKKYNSMTLDSEEKLAKVITSLNREKNRIGKDCFKRSIDFEKTEKIGKNFIINKDDINKLKKISCSFDPNKSSSYACNCNDYYISNAEKNEDERNFYYIKKPIIRINPLNYKKEVIYPEPYKFPRWGVFSENYYILSNKIRGFDRKGGLFTELANKNEGSFKLLQEEVREKLKQKKEKEKLFKNKILSQYCNNNITNNQLINYNLSELNVNRLKMNLLSPSDSMHNLLIRKKFKELISPPNKQVPIRNRNNFIKYKDFFA